MIVNIILFLFMIFVNILILKSVKEPKNLQIVKEKYQRLREYIKTNDVDEKFHVLKNPILISGFVRNYGQGVGYNTNKGYEIGLCLDGDPNEIFHVLLHELAHSMSSTYSHDAEFWKNFDDLKKLCQKQNLYSPIKTKSEFCGRYIQDQ